MNFPCLMTRSEARAAAGLGLLLAGFMIAGGGVVLILISAGIRGAPLAAAAAVPEAGAVAGAARTAAPARGTVADDKGTSPEFRRMFLGGDK